MELDDIILRALSEDIGNGDHTSLSTVPENAEGTMYLLAKENGVIAGVDIAQRIATLHDANLLMEIKKQDGEQILKGDIVFTLKGNIRSMLSCERVILNFMQRMSGIATYTKRLANEISGYQTKILDTRKTTPQFRLLEKMAVVIGGGYNHRFGLYDMILVKDNHIDFAGGITHALNKVFDYLSANQLELNVEVEVRNLDELHEVVSYGKVKRVLLDNFTPELMKEAVSIIDGRFETEASGMIRLENIKAYAETGVDYISIGALTHHVRSLDLSLKASL